MEQKMQIFDFLVEVNIILVQILAKKSFTFKQGRLGNRRHTYIYIFFGLKYIGIF